MAASRPHPSTPSLRDSAQDATFREEPGEHPEWSPTTTEHPERSAAPLEHPERSAAPLEHPERSAAPLEHPERSAAESKDAVAAEKQAHYLLRSLREAVREFDMIREGDRIAVAVSGGKDSLALLSLLARHRPNTPVRFELAAIHVRGDATGVLAPHPPLEEWLARQGVEYRIVEPELTDTDEAPLSCQRCTWLRRKALFFAADALGCNVLAYAHHADDAAQTTLLNLLYSGSPHTLAPVADYFEGRFRLIRPLVYTPEKEIARFARASGFPPPPTACPRGVDSRRAKVKEMLALLGREYPLQARGNLIRVGIAHTRTTPRR